MFIDRHITSKNAWIIYVMQIIRHWAVGVLLLLNSITTFFLIWADGIGIFSQHRSAVCNKWNRTFRSGWFGL